MDNLKNISLETIKNIEDLLDYKSWETLSEKYEITIDILREYKKELNWGIMSTYQPFTIKMLEEFQDKISWESYSTYNPYITKEIIDKFEDKLNWYTLINHYNFSQEETEYYLEKYLFKTEDKIRNIKCNRISREFLRKHADKFNWTTYSLSANVPEDFIEEFKDKVNWQGIYLYNVKLKDLLSKEFKEKYKNELTKAANTIENMKEAMKNK